MTQASQRKDESLRQSVQSLTRELLTVYEELALLYTLGAKIGWQADEDQIASVSLREAMNISSAKCGWVVLWENETFRVPENCRMEIDAGIVAHINKMLLEPLHHQGKRQVLFHRLNEECQIDRPDVPARFLASCLPVAGISRGYLCLGRHHQDPIFTSADQKLINAVATLTAVELENARLQRSELEKQRLANELELARTIQQSLLPRDFCCSNFLEAAGVSEPCYEIGGDYFDLIPLGSDVCLLVIADVAGKGPPAALQAAMVQGIVHGVLRHSQEVSRLMGTMNKCILARAVEGRFITAFLATLDRAGRLRYTNGGHNPPIWIQKNGQVVEFSEGGLLLGFMKTASYPEGSAQLEPGDLLLLYTDGITDAADEHQETFGTHRLLDWASQQVGRRPIEVKENLVHTVRQFCGKSRQADDLTVLVIQYKGPS
jgi:serine phosphatase RsbU (regulator of sigma subunit)